jgi:hypothetical protein
MYQRIPLQYPPKFIQIRDFWFASLPSGSPEMDSSWQAHATFPLREWHYVEQKKVFFVCDEHWTSQEWKSK